MEKYIKHDLETFSEKNFHALCRLYGLPYSWTSLDEIVDIHVLMAKLLISQSLISQSPLLANFPGSDDDNEYNEIVGGGGFGTIYGNATSDRVVKYLNLSHVCTDAQQEYLLHKRIYNAVNYANKNVPHKYTICISAPIDYSSEPIIKNNTHYKCKYIMSRLQPYADNYLYHIVNDDYADMFNKVVGRIPNKPISSDNPPRGFFATYSYVTDNLKDVNITHLLECMGYAFGIMLFVAEILPIDVEYVLSRDAAEKVCLAILDFGMTKRVDFNDYSSTRNAVIYDILEVDIYFPTSEQPHHVEAVKRGLKDAYYISNQTTFKQKLFDDIILLWQ